MLRNSILFRRNLSNRIYYFWEFYIYIFLFLFLKVRILLRCLKVVERFDFPMKKMMSAWFKKKGSINFTQNKVQIESVKLECTVLHSLTLIDEERVCGESEMRRRNIDLVSIKWSKNQMDKGNEKRKGRKETRGIIKISRDKDTINL